MASPTEAKAPAEPDVRDPAAAEPPGTPDTPPAKPLHVAIIMDGNGRWATQRGLARSAGHRAGLGAVRRVVKAAAQERIDILTLFAFSADNWQRPQAEVSAIMGLLRRYLAAEVGECVRHGIKITVLGRRNRLSSSIVRVIQHAESATADCKRLQVRLAIDYSGRDAILHAAARLRTSRRPSRMQFAALLRARQEGRKTAPDVDFLIRAGGEQRLSDFMLWESAYAELYFSDLMWPDFDAGALAAAMTDFRARQRRFGAVPEATEPSASARVV